MDNLGSHKSPAVRHLIRSAGAKLFFLPRYSPDLNPIEQVFAKLKTLLRKTDALVRRGGQLVIHPRPRSCDFRPASERWTKWILGWFLRLSFLF